MTNPKMNVCHLCPNLGTYSNEDSLYTICYCLIDTDVGPRRVANCVGRENLLTGKFELDERFTVPPECPLILEHVACGELLCPLTP